MPCTFIDFLLIVIDGLTVSNFHKDVKAQIEHVKELF